MSALQELRDRMDKRSFDDYKAAVDWVLENWACPDDPPATVTQALTDLFEWGDGAWGTAGRAEEKTQQLLQQIRLAGGFLEFEGNALAASQILQEALAGKEPVNQVVDVDPSMADWTPDCFNCAKPIGDWRNCWMLPAGPEDDEPTTVVFVHKHCG